MPRGGRRAPKPGAAYSNRTDLNTRLPATAATGQPYGQAGQQLAAQQAVPMGTPPVPPPAQPTAPTAPPPYTSPDDVPSLAEPTMRPNEPVTHGLPVGPGAGPEALGGLQQPLSPLTQGVAILNSLGSHLPPELQAVAKYLNVTQSNGQAQ